MHRYSAAKRTFTSPGPWALSTPLCTFYPNDTKSKHFLHTHSHRWLVAATTDGMFLYLVVPRTWWCYLVVLAA